MIDEATRTPVAEARPGPDRWRSWWLGVFFLVLIVVTGFLVGRDLEAAGAPTAHRTSAAQPTAPPSAAPSAPLLEATTAAPTPTAPSPTPTVKLLQMSGSVPTHGSGTFAYATRTGEVFGTKGPLRRFRVAVEKGSNEDVDDFADQVEAALGDARSWTGGGSLRLQMVPNGRPYDFTVYLATRDTAGEMCRRGGTDTWIGGRPYTSCRTTGKAIINLDRWRLSAKPYLNARVPLAIYRQYVINHEVGHELGHHHQGCPAAGGPAPVMVQQTLTLRGCVPNAWPRHGNHFLTGPPVG
jgi:hypothetical protein